MKQRIWYLLLTVVTSLVMFSGKVNAEEKLIPENYIVATSMAAYETDGTLEVVEYGNCGVPNVTWAVTTEGILVIGGNGMMWDFKSSWGSTPWFDYRNSIYGVVVMGDVKNVGEYAFCDIPNLQIALIEDGVRRIRQGAFKDCINLEIIELPDTVTEIDESAFYNCKISTIKLPNNLRKISSSMFSCCTELESIEIPNSVQQIGAAAFSGCSSLKKITIPKGVTSLEDGTFHYCASLTEVNIPNTVLSIGQEVFAECKALKTISIPGSVDRIGFLAFANCSGLREVNIAQGVSILDMKVFYNCDALEKIVLPNSIKLMEEYIFADCNNLKEVGLPEYITEIPANTFRGCKKLENVIIPLYVTEIDNEAFFECDSLKTIEIPSLVEKIDERAFFGCDNLITMNIPTNVTEIGSGVFKNCAKLHKVSILNPEISIWASAFENDNNLLIRCHENSKAHNHALLWNYEYEFLDMSLATDCFVDVLENEWYVEAVQYVFDNGLMSGSGDYFKPTKNMTRAQLVTTLYRLSGSPEVTDYSACEEFPDVSRGEYYTEAVCWAYNEGITTGSNGMFNTGGNLSRQQLATFFYRYAEVMGYDTTDRGDYSALLNADKVDEYAMEAMEWAVGAGLVSGSKIKDTDGNVVYDLNPQGNTTRAQLAAILQRFCEKYEVFQGQEV